MIISTLFALYENIIYSFEAAFRFSLSYFIFRIYFIYEYFIYFVDILYIN